MNTSTEIIRCEACGEIYCTTWPEQMAGGGGSAAIFPGGVLGASVTTGGIPCPRCGRRNSYRPGQDAVADTAGALLQWPEVAAALSPCSDGQDLWRDPAYRVAVERARALANEPPPDPNEIVDIITGKNADGEGPFYRVIRCGRLGEPVVFPCGDQLNELLENDSDFHDYETFLYVLTEEGEVVFTHEWDSGGPGAGAGVECVYELAGKFYYPCEWAGLYGPYDTVDEAVEGDLLTVNTASTDIGSSYHNEEELAERVEFEGYVVEGQDERLGHKIWFNNIPYVWSKPGVLVRKEDDDDGIS